MLQDEGNYQYSSPKIVVFGLVNLKGLRKCLLSISMWQSAVVLVVWMVIGGCLLNFGICRVSLWRILRLILVGIIVVAVGSTMRCHFCKAL